jgi:hypothetical protein
LNNNFIGCRYMCYVAAGELLYAPLTRKYWMPCPYGGFVFLFEDTHDPRDCYFPLCAPYSTEVAIPSLRVPFSFLRPSCSLLLDLESLQQKIEESKENMKTPTGYFLNAAITAISVEISIDSQECVSTLSLPLPPRKVC